MIIPEPVILKEQERLRLEGMANSAKTTLAKRAKILLCCAEGKNNTEVAKELSVHIETVSLWRHRFNEQGISALTESLKGSKPKVPYEEIDETISALLENGTKDYTVKKIAEITGYSYRQVDESISRLGITLARQRHWEYFTADDTTVNRSAIMAVLLSKQLSVVITAKAPWGFSTTPGRFLTYNKQIYEDIRLVNHEVTLGHTLSAMTNRIKPCKVNRGNTILQHVNLLLHSLYNHTDLAYHVFSLCDSLPSYSGDRHEDFSMEWYSDQDDWLLAIHDWIGQNSSGLELLQTERLEKGITRYLENCTEETGTFIWDRNVIVVGSETFPIHSDKDSETNVLMDIVREQLPDGAYPSANGELSVAFLPFAFDHTGGAYSLICSTDKINVSDFAFDSVQGFMNGVNKTELQIAQIRDEAGKVAYDLLIELVKKKDPLSL